MKGSVMRLRALILRASIAGTLLLASAAGGGWKWNITGH